MYSEVLNIKMNGIRGEIEAICRFYLHYVILIGNKVSSILAILDFEG